MPSRTTTRGAIASSLVLLAMLTAAASASASSDQRRIVARDDCDQASFNVAIGPGTCIGDGRTAFGDFIGQLMAEGAADGWSFSRPDFGLDAGGDLKVENRGGEFHTFTEVAHFGGGCVPELNAVLGLTPVPECAAVTDTPDGPVPTAFITSGVGPGGTLAVDDLTPGKHRFICLIHPWMRSTAKVRDDD